jgi:hypothetical protein
MKQSSVPLTLEHFFAIQIPSWTLVFFIALAWWLQHSLKRFVRTWALLTLPATILHEFAHWLIGYIFFAQPVNFNFWPKRVGASSWRLGYVGFAKLRWWNGGAVALAPLCWILLLATLFKQTNQLPKQLTVQMSVMAGLIIVWLWIAVAPSKSDWQLARDHWASGIIFLVGWVAAVVLIVRLS